MRRIKAVQATLGGVEDHQFARMEVLGNVWNANQGRYAQLSGHNGGVGEEASLFNDEASGLPNQEAPSGIGVLGH